MRATKSWIAEYADLPAGLSAWQLADALVSVGLEVEQVEAIGGDVSGPVVIGRVVDFVEEPQKNGKTIRWCHVDVGPEHAPKSPPAPLVKGGEVPELRPSRLADARTSGSAEGPGAYWPRGVICGALNFAPGDHVVVALPGATLPGPFPIGSRKTYGHVSDGMICAEDELGLGDDHAGIIVLGEVDDEGNPWTIGAPALEAMGVSDDVLDMPVTPDMGHCLSVRGLAREASQALHVAYRDVIAHATPAPSQGGHPVVLESEACPLFVALTVEGFDPAAESPAWMKQRLSACGMRSISLSVDISNYVMLETGQPNHCYDADTLQGAIVVRQAKPGERITTLDDVVRTLDEADLVITDDRGPIGIAGVMGGEDTELRDTTTRIVIEAANFDPVSIARTSRRHKLGSEASRRFERSVDPGAAYGAARRVADLLIELGGGRLAAETVAGEVPAMPVQTIDAGLPERILGMPVAADRVVEILTASGVEVARDGDTLTLTPPSWRADLVDPYDYVEEVGIKVGYEHLPSVVPAAPVGRGYTTEQKLRRAIGRALAASGFVEVLTFPWASAADADALGLDADDPRRRTVALTNPLAETAPLLRTTILPGLFGAVARNASRGADDLALFEAGRVFFASETGEAAPLPSVDGRPSDEELEAIERAIPWQPRNLAAVLTGAWMPAGWQGAATLASWTQAIAFAEIAAAVVGVRLERRSAQQAPWHPGRCAELVVGEEVIGYAGELHPSVVKAFDLPTRTAAVEIDLDLLVSLFDGAGVLTPVSSQPVAKEDIALIVDESVPVADLQEAVVAGGGELLESVRLFDIYRGAPVPEGKKSVAFALRLRASDRTLTDADAAGVREASVAVAVERFGAELRA
ncbi:phenylalanine--tRNA ligase subunit beta [Propioniciclava sinopodophylli]|uniref:Phenylalanine--tRNA ligase beta subunit n=1 Tax=Propioniciclava sinopodophylli TaxID=1837344 RepID=A0A4Q9KF55_9ACTN|nr:phenylalanine--tRNA ligase subunit beta [Propioniciclava sinopodophylli]TBT84367.1 phenylalanine--tRNA ligase subunit beta [Propioniciclava sinopodophylli]